MSYSVLDYLDLIFICHPPAYLVGRGGGHPSLNGGWNFFDIGDTDNNCDPTPLQTLPASAKIEISIHLVAKCST